jgi:hypothetical protein
LVEEQDKELTLLDLQLQVDQEEVVLPPVLELPVKVTTAAAHTKVQVEVVKVRWDKLL